MGRTRKQIKAIKAKNEKPFIPSKKFLEEKEKNIQKGVIRGKKLFGKGFTRKDLG